LNADIAAAAGRCNKRLETSEIADELAPSGP